MKFTRGDTILHELGHHLPFTLAASLLAGVLVAIVYNFWVIPSESFFEVLHPAHVLVSAAATSAIYYKYKPGFARSVYRGIGVSGYRGIGRLGKLFWLGLLGLF